MAFWWLQFRRGQSSRARSKRRSANIRPTRPRFLATLECLEDRCVPTTVQFAAPVFNVAENAASALITVSLDTSAAVPIQVDYATTSGGSAVDGTDFAATNGTLVFQPGEMSQSFNVPLIDAGVTEPPETVDLQLTNAQGATLGALDSTTLTIWNVHFTSVPGAQTADPNTALTFSSAGGNPISVSLPAAGSNPVQVALAVTNGTLTLGTESGLTFTGGSDGSPTMTIQGSVSDINQALDGLQYNPDPGYAGSDVLTIGTDDLGNNGTGNALTDSATVPLTVNPVNPAPQVGSPGDQTNIEGDQVVVPVPAYSPLDDPLTFAATGLPSGLSIDPNSGIITGTIASGAATTNGGIYAVTVTATDAANGAGANATFNWNVATVLVSSPGDQTNIEGDQPVVPISASGPAGDPLTYAATGLPSGLSIDPNSGIITGTIASGAATTNGGIYAVTVTATDAANGAGANATFNWTVATVLVASPGDQTNLEGDQPVVPISASGPASDPLTYAATGLPSGLSIDPNSGIITGTIASGAATTNGGMYAVTVTATDAGNGASGNATFNWTVFASIPQPPAGNGDPGTVVSYPIDLVPVDISTDPVGSPGALLTAIPNPIPTFEPPQLNGIRPLLFSAMNSLPSPAGSPSSSNRGVSEVASGTTSMDVARPTARTSLAAATVLDHPVLPTPSADVVSNGFDPNGGAIPAPEVRGPDHPTPTAPTDGSATGTQGSESIAASLFSDLANEGLSDGGSAAGVLPASGMGPAAPPDFSPITPDQTLTAGVSTDATGTIVGLGVRTPVTGSPINEPFQVAATSDVESSDPSAFTVLDRMPAGNPTILWWG